ncbi:MAG: hypothetical protein GF365_01760 [Candidatus Buchananbacteria bacterium]|nr:hypothetical protein [Candidatus Buchananbacteria bacterium]
MKLKYKNLNKLSFFALLANLFIVQHALAGDYGLGTAAQKAGLPGQGEEGGAGIATFLGSFAGAALALSGSIFLFLIIYGGIYIMTAAGNQEKVKKGKDVIIWAIIGAVILGSAYAITSIVFGVFGQ